MKLKHIRHGMYITVATGLSMTLGAACTGSSVRTQSSAAAKAVGTVTTASGVAGSGTGGAIASGSAASPPTVPPSDGRPGPISTTGVVRTTVPRPPATSTSTAAPHVATGTGSGVRGTVTAGPTCPVERAGMPCPPKAVVAAVVAHNAAGSVVATTMSDAGGNFAMVLAPGQYTLAVGGGATLYPRCQSTSVTVLSGQQATANIGCDTGIR